MTFKKKKEAPELRNPKEEKPEKRIKED